VPHAPAEAIAIRRWSLDRVRVLVVDDEPDARALLRETLTQAGAVVVAAASVAEALPAIGRLRPHVLISDIAMPEADGYELIRKLRAAEGDAGPKTPAVALTAYARAEDRIRALAAGYQAHVAKPVEPRELVYVVAGLAGIGPRR
jgi:CheY-like chemotaxis protein